MFLLTTPYPSLETTEREMITAETRRVAEVF